jgi:DNA polymerase-3 subunit epsilon
VEVSSPNHHPGDGAPPHGAPWDSPFAEASFAFVDLEMTGLKVGEDRVIEVCIERVRGADPEILEARVATLVHPGERRGNVHVHGIDDAALDAAPAFGDVADEICAALGGAIVVAHAAGWDLAFLRDELGRVNQSSCVPSHAIDTLVLCRRAFHMGGYGLQNVARTLEIPVVRAHRAGDDVATMREIWRRLVKELAPKTPRDLWDVRVQERMPRPQILEKLEAALAKGEAATVVYRPARRGAERLTFVVTALVPPHAMGYLLPGRGRRELRIDRILRIEPPPEPLA